MTYTPRVVDRELDELLEALPAIAVEGPKGVGKTATAARRANTVFRLDEPAQREIAAADPSVLITASPPVLIDEWQHVPPVWDAVRRAVDDGALPGRYLLAGSAVAKNLPTHSGAARIVSLRMRPLALSERGLVEPTVSLRELLTGAKSAVSGTSPVDLTGYTDEILRSGFPGLYHLIGRARRASLDGYIDHVLNRDIREQGYTVRRPDTLRRWMAAYAAATARTTSLEKIRNAATSGDGEIPNRVTVTSYLDILERLWLIEPLEGWVPSRNHLTRIAQSPKHHLADPALAARLLGADATALLHGMTAPDVIPRDGALLGQLFESLVTLSVRVYAQAAEAHVRHLRMLNGRQEIDLIVERDDHRVLAIEVKLSETVTDDDVKHLHWLRGKIGNDLLDAVVLTTGLHAYRRRDGIAVIPAALLGP